MSHPEKQATYSKRYYSQPDKKEMKRQYNKQYQIDHKDRLGSIRKQKGGRVKRCQVIVEEKELKQKGERFKGGLTIDKQEIVLSFN